MPRIFSSKVLFPCTFAQAAQAVWQKYPNPYAEHVRSVDVLDRRVCPDTGIIHTERIITVELNAPRWIRRLLGTHGDTYVHEHITVDPKALSVEMNSTNLSFTDLICVQENVRYTPWVSEDGNSREPHPPSVLFDQHAAIRCLGLLSGHRAADDDKSLLSHVIRRIEDAGHARFGEHAAGGRLGFASVLQSMFGSGEDAQKFSPTVLEG